MSKLSNFLYKFRFVFASATLALGLFACRDGKDAPQSVETDQGDYIDLALKVKLPLATRADGTPLPAEQPRSIRLVIVDLGVAASDGVVLDDPKIEYNRLLTKSEIKHPADNQENSDSSSDSDDNGSQSGTLNNNGIYELSVANIRADRKKKMFLMVNSEPTLQPYLNIRLEDGTPVEGYGDESMFFSGYDGISPIENAVFTAPIGSYLNNNISDESELLTPMNAVFEFSVPTVKEIAAQYPSLNPKLTYPIPGELLVVRAVNKIWFEFINDTYKGNGTYDPLELLVTGWTFSEINQGESYFFGHPDESSDLFKTYSTSPTNINKPWVQWINDEASRSPQLDFTGYRWLTLYDMPEGAENKTLNFAPNNYEGGMAGKPKDSEGILLSAPTRVDQKVKKTTENLPVYFAETKSGNPQQYELGFTVWQREKGATEWSNPYYYSITSSTNVSDDSTFHLLSLFRNTDVVMTVTFVRGRSAVDFTVEVHPYGSVTLQPEFGL